MLNEKNKPLNAYEGDEPYLFVSYAPEDEHVAFQEIKRFQDMGYNVWYNEDNKIENKLKYSTALKNCSVYVVLLTHNSGYNNKIIEEVNYVFNLEKNIIPIYLDETKIDIIMESTLSDSSRIDKYELKDITQYMFKCRETFMSYGLQSGVDASNNKSHSAINREPLPAFRGEGSYMFISYAHIDSNLVFPEIKRFQDMGYNVWYDEGICAGNEWLRDVLEHLVDSDLFVVFITNNSVLSKNVQKELKFAVSKEKNIVPIYLEDFDEIDMDIQLDYELSQLQGILKTDLDDESYISKFTEAFHSFGFDPDYGNIFEKIELKTPEEILIDDSLKNEVLYSDINSNSIKRYIDEFFDNLVLSENNPNECSYKDILKLTINNFLDNKYMYTAWDVYYTFFSIYQIISSGKSSYEGLIDKNVTLDILEKIKNFTEDIRLQKNLFIHSVNVFVLGLAIYSGNRNYKKAFNSYVIGSGYEEYYKIDDEISSEEFLYRWGMTSLLHDIYYPFEKNGRRENRNIYGVFDNFLGENRIIRDIHDLNEIIKKEPFKFTDNYEKKYPKTKYFNLFKPTEIIAHKIAHNFKFDNEKCNLLRNHINDFIAHIKDTEFAEHGFLSALLVLNMFDYQIQEYAIYDYNLHEYSINPDLFFYPIADSAVAIFLHNYYKYFLQKEPFNQKQLNPSQNPLAYLLILCDNVLEFYRHKDLNTEDNINELFISQLNDERLTITCKASSYSYGFGFSNELYLDNLLDIPYIFDEGVCSKTDLTNVNEEDILTSTSDLSNNTVSMSLIEELAKAVHKQYQILSNKLTDESQIKNYKFEEFNELSPQDKVINMVQSKSIPGKLSSIGYEITDIIDEREDIVEFSEDEIIYIAKVTHKEWYKDKKENGWEYSKIKDDKKRLNPNLLPWDKLNEEVQQQNTDFVSSIPNIVMDIGLKIVPSKLRLLTSEIYKLSSEDEFNTLTNKEEQYEKINESTDDKFDTLSLDMKRLNFKKTDLIIETLSMLNYYLVDSSYNTEEITFLENDEAIYLAQEYHKKYRMLNYSLGWKHGDNYDEELKTNPYLVKWDKDYLSADYAKIQVKIFKQLPDFCKKLNLKIIRNTYEI
ncbi:toll/interleukin-1 receptor domain-containing protein [Methanosphaera sp. BMS]|uniref:toll/interleukin-1 receptor domain-containing protein n=1 Tax=Methanosphaera sp. BMS TaxID=1789762 RepID=UPI000DC1D36A|nr:toll/interleukin-1 receptor domain-containing protein [Methanosphaera sp. BMS]AWX31687.1 hypothetical protein AW729_00670 [Methanosphaera sp. BMS]